MAALPDAGAFAPQYEGMNAALAIGKFIPHLPHRRPKFEP
jgi:hypothetical protein